MSSDWRPKPGNRLLSIVDVDQPIPDGWQRSDGIFPTIVWRIATGEPADTALPIDGYSETVDCGLTSPKRAARG